MRLFPFPICHTIQFPIMGEASNIAFQHIEFLDPKYFGVLMQSTNEKPEKYFEYIILPQRILLWWSFHNHFTAKDLKNKKMFLMPHMPISFGMEIFIYFTRGIPPASFCPDQINWEHIFLIFLKIPFRILAKYAQYIGMIERTDFIKVSLPPLF